MGRERSHGYRNSRGRGSPEADDHVKDAGYESRRHSHGAHYSRHQSKRERRSHSRSPSPRPHGNGNRRQSRSGSLTPLALDEKRSSQHCSKRRSNDLGNGRSHHSQGNGHDKYRYREKSHSRSRSPSTSPHPYHRHPSANHRDDARRKHQSRSQSRSRSPQSYHHRPSANHRDDVSRKHRASPTQVRVSPSRSGRNLSYSRESDQVGLPEKAKRHNNYDSDREGRSSPTYLPYSVRENEHAANRDHGKVNDYDSDEKDLENLSPHEYRMVKRERLRKRMVACIWRATPSPPHEDGACRRYRGMFGNEDLDEKGLIMSLDDKADTLGHTGADVDMKEPNHNEEKVVAVKDASPLKAYSDKSRADSSSEEDGPRKQKKKKSASQSSHRRRTQKVHALKNESSSESSDEEISSSDSYDQRQRKNKRKERREKFRTKTKASSSGRKKKGKPHKRHHYSSSDEEDDDDQKDEKDSINKLLIRQEKGGVSLLSSFETDLKESSSNGETDKDDDTAVEIDEEAMKFKVLLDAQKKSAVALENEPIVGPAPAPKAEGHISYGGALRPGEGDAIAQYVQQGKRIPRRGEVGLSAEEIQKYEGLGYVMSGSRHQRMNAIRIRKENQVYSAEDKRALAMFNYEEKAKREHQVMSDLQRLIQRHIGQDPGPTHDPFAVKQADPPPDT